MPTDADIAELKQYCETLGEGSESGVTYYVLGGLRLPPGCTPAISDALFCPKAPPAAGYPSRLYFATKVVTPFNSAPNWNYEGTILERRWHAYSYMVNKPDLSFIETFKSHLTMLARPRPI